MVGELSRRRLSVATRYESDKMPVGTMPAIRRDTLAPWVLRVGTATSRRASSRRRGRPGGRRETGRRARAGQGAPAPLIPVLTSVPPPIGTWPTASPRRRANGPRRAAQPAPPADQDHGPAGPCPAAPRCRGACLPAAGRRPGVVPGRPRPCRPVAAPDRPAPDRPALGRPGAGQPRVGRPLAGRPGAAQGPPRPYPLVADRPEAPPGRPRPRPPAAGRRGTPPGPTRPGRLVTAPGRPRPRRRAACPTPVTAVPGR
jgi:hypothetical protein